MKTTITSSPLGFATYRGQTVPVLKLWREQYDVPRENNFRLTEPGPAWADIALPDGRRETVPLDDLSDFGEFKPYPHVSFEPQI